MLNKNQKNQKQPEQQPGKQPSTPVKPVELTDEELGQVVGGAHDAFDRREPPTAVIAII